MDFSAKISAKLGNILAIKSPFIHNYNYHQEYIIHRESIERPYRSCCMSAYLLKVTFRILQYTLSMNIIIKRHMGCHSHELAMARGPNSWILTALLL